MFIPHFDYAVTTDFDADLKIAYRKGDLVMKRDQHELTSEQLASLRQGIVACFSMEELRTACFDLGMDYDSLTGDGKEGKAREIISFLSRRGDLSRLMDYCFKMRPSYTWFWLGILLEKQARNVDFEIEVRCSDILDFACDVIALKFAQSFFGADGLVAKRITDDPYQEIAPRPGDFVLLPSRGKLAARQALFIGVPDLYRFDYGQIREFARRSIEIIASDLPSVKHMAMTMHGVGFGLDEREAFLAQIAGLLDASRNSLLPPFLERITIVEHNSGRAERLEQLLAEYLPSRRFLAGETGTGTNSMNRARINAAGTESNAKPHIFVAMPFGEEMEDTYVFGIQGPVNSAGYLCERVDMTLFTGDVLDRIKSRIDTATLVIADLSGANPNVYLEVGYAWGRNRLTVLIARQSEQLKFDVRNQRCLLYKNIADLAKKLTLELHELPG